MLTSLLSPHTLSTLNTQDNMLAGKGTLTDGSIGASMTSLSSSITARDPHKDANEHYGNPSAENASPEPQNPLTLRFTEAEWIALRKLRVRSSGVDRQYSH